MLASLSPGAKARFSAGRFVGVEDGAALFALPNKATVDNCEPRRAEVEAALAAHFGTPVRIRLLVDQAGPAATADGNAADDAESLDTDGLEDAPAAIASPEGRLLEAFPGAEEVRD